MNSRFQNSRRGVARFQAGGTLRDLRESLLAMSAAPATSWIEEVLAKSSLSLWRYVCLCIVVSTPLPFPTVSACIISSLIVVSERIAYYVIVG